MVDSSRKSRIMIVDDHPMVREGLGLRISSQSDLAVCGEAATEDDAVRLAAEAKPDLVVVDISLKQGHGIELIRRIAERYKRIKVLVFSGFQESLYAERALRAGAMGYLNKQESNDKVLEAIRTVLNGERYVSPAMTRRLVTQALTNRESEKEPIELLSNRELEVFRLIAEGLSTGAIANQLHLSPHTIDTHRENIKRKLGSKNAAELNRQAVQWLLENG